MSEKNDILDLEFYSLTENRFKDLEILFGKKGACGGCWCMWWRLKKSQFEKQKGIKNKNALKKIVKSGEIPGLLCYSNGLPIAWCAVAPRERYIALENSRILKRIDKQPVWSIVCFYVLKQFRKKGITIKLLKAAIDYVSSQGGKIIEGYPVEAKKGKMPDIFAWTGFSSAFLKAGFVEVMRRSQNRPIMRYYI